MNFTDIVKGNFKAFKDSVVSGRNPVNTEEKITFKDALSVPNASVWMPRAISEIALEAIEPNLLLTGLLDRVRYQAGLQIITGGVGALTASDIAEGQEYPEQQLQVGGSSVVASVGKSGVAFKMTEEMKRYSQFDIFNLHLRAAGRALARHKEKKVATYITSLGCVVFDNAQPTSSLLGTTLGRDQDGNPNGSITWDDMFDLFGVVINNGFMPDLLIMHPLTWVLFMKDAVLRSFALASGGGVWWGSYTGRPDGRAPWGIPKTHRTTGQNITPENVQGSSVTGLNGMPQVPTMNSAPVFPNHMMPFAFKIIVTPYVYYDPSSKLTDIIVCDSTELGALIVDEEVTTDQWNDPSVDIMKVKLRERYGIHIYNEGLAIAVAKNVKVVANEVVLPARATLDASSLPTLDRTVASV